MRRGLNFRPVSIEYVGYVGYAGYDLRPARSGLVHGETLGDWILFSLQTPQHNHNTNRRREFQDTVGQQGLGQVRTA